MNEAPDHLYALEPLVEDGNVKALNRIAFAIEQLTLAVVDATSQKPAAAPQVPAGLPVLPPVQNVAVNPVNAGCPVHRQPWKLVPAGISKKTNQPYKAFWACPERGCDQRPA